jgi:hypothetical protein
MSCSSIFEFIPGKVKSGEFLCVEKKIYIYEKDDNKIKITLLVFKASAICFTSVSPILFSERSREMSAFTLRKQ